MEMNYILLGKNIRKFRTATELTQEKLAAIIGCSDRHIGKIEHAETIPSLATTVAIANGLNVGIDQLVYGDLKNRTDYFIQELVSLTGNFDGKDKLMAIEMVKALLSVIKDFKF